MRKTEATRVREEMNRTIGVKLSVQVRIEITGVIGMGEIVQKGIIGRITIETTGNKISMKGVIMITAQAGIIGQIMKGHLLLERKE